MATDAGAARPACPLCGGGGERAVVYRLRPFDVVRCPACGGLQRDPLPDQQEMESYYRDAAYLGGTYFSEAAAGPEAALHREALDWLAARRRARGLATTGRLLDVGAGSGAFLAAARRQGWDAQGLEISPELADRAQAHSGAVVRTGDFASMALADGAFDCVAMWDVLEHCLDPGVFLDRACSLLAPAAGPTQTDRERVLSELHASRKQFLDAVREYQKFLDLYPSDPQVPSVRKSLETSYFLAGQEDSLTMEEFLRRFPQLAVSPLETVESLEQLRVLWHGERIAVHLAAQAPGAGVDTPEDLARVRHLLSTA